MSQTSLKVKMLEAFRFRMYFFVLIVAVFFLILITQVINLQLIHGKEYKLKSKLNMESYIPIPAIRGEIYDRNFKIDKPGFTIVTNRPSFNITTIPARFKSKNEFNRILKNLFSMLKDDKSESVEGINNKNRWERSVIIEDVSFESIVKVASKQYLYPNIDWEDAPVRVYNFKGMFSHVVGYIGSISKNEYRRLKKNGYKYYQKIGKTGVERQYDKILRGQDGFIRRIVDVKNRTEGEEVGLKPVGGNNLVLTLDYRIQQTAYEAMGELNGATIVLKPSTGEILSLVSKPDFDPNQIISKDNSSIVSELLKDENRPFLNRSIQGKYPPASTFKLITAIASLETEKAFPSKTFYCSGKYTLKGYKDKDFYCIQAHGRIDMLNAIAKSCSSYFYQLAYSIGPTAILKYAGYFGLNEKTLIDIPGEEKGFIPSKKWKLRTFGQTWFDGDTINLSIGQGFISVTPIAMANFIAGIVNNGIVYRPQIIKEIHSADNKTVIQKFKKYRLRETPLSPLTLRSIKQGMRMGVLSGTQTFLKDLKVQVAGKTGTAQTKSNRKENASQHAWYVGYAPYDAPAEKAVVVAVMIEYGRWGASTAVPVAKKIFAKMDELGFFK